MGFERKLLEKASKEEIKAWAELLNLEVDGRSSKETIVARLRDAGEMVDDEDYTIPIIPQGGVAPAATPGKETTSEWRRFDPKEGDWVPCDEANIALYRRTTDEDGRGAWVEADMPKLVYLRDIKLGSLEYRETLPDGSTATARLGQGILISTEKRAGGDRPVKVTTNGRGKLIPRGKPVWVPLEYMDNLKNAVESRFEQGGENEQVKRDMSRFAVNYGVPLNAA